MSIILRCAFVLLVGLGVGERALWRQAGAGNRDSGAALAASLTKIGLVNVGVDPSGLFEAAAPGCPAAIRIGLMALDGSEDARFRQLVGAGGHPLFIYLGKVAQHREPRDVVTAWLAANGETVLGLRRSQAPNKLVLAILPTSCPGLARLNWAALSR